LDDGRLTDSSGVTVDFTNTIIIATSNVGTRSIQEALNRGDSFAQAEQTVLKDVRDHFAPEFLNRFTDLVVFNPLTIDVIKQIAQLMLTRVITLAHDKGIELTFAPELLNELCARGFNQEWGARPMSRL